MQQRAKRRRAAAASSLADLQEQVTFLVRKLRRHGSSRPPRPKFCRNGRNCRPGCDEVLTARGRISVDVPVSGIASTDSPLVTKELAMTKKYTGRSRAAP
jgi:hypothetical protein